MAVPGGCDKWGDEMHLSSTSRHVPSLDSTLPSHWVTGRETPPPPVSRPGASGSMGDRMGDRMESGREIAWRSDGDNMEIAWRSDGDSMEIGWRSDGDRMEIAWR